MPREIHKRVRESSERGKETERQKKRTDIWLNSKSHVTLSSEQSSPTTTSGLAIASSRDSLAMRLANKSILEKFKLFVAITESIFCKTNDSVRDFFFKNIKCN